MNFSHSARLAALDERGRIMARVGHLIPRKRVEIARAVQLLRIHFNARRPRSPKNGTLYRIMLVGRHARAGDTPDCETGEINAYDLWALVDHPAYRGLNRSWGLARRAVAASLRGRATVTLSVFTCDEIDRLRVAGNRFLTNRYDGGIILYDRGEEPSVGGRDGDD